jgi:hypothetical protein
MPVKVLVPEPEPELVLEPARAPVPVYLSQFMLGVMSKGGVEMAVSAMSCSYKELYKFTGMWIFIPVMNSITRSLS